MKRLVHFFRLFLCTIGISCLLSFAGCGSGSSGGGGNPPPPPPPDFSISVQPASITLAQGSSGTVDVSVSGINEFSSQVNVTISGAPNGVSPSPSSFTLSAGGQQTVTFTAAPNAASGTATLSVAGTSGALSHTAALGLGIDTQATGMHPPFRTRYLRTDAQWDYGFINFFPQQWIIYDPATKRFFANNTTQNRIDVFDATTESQIAEIPIPGPWVSDETPDHSIIYVGTQLGDVYTVDPVAMVVTNRIPSIQIGPTGYPTYEVRALADGRLVLLGGQGGIPAVDGYQNFGVWNPADNSLIVLGSSYGGSGPGEPTVCDPLGDISEFQLTADRTRVIIGSADSDGTLCIVDPNTANYVIVQTPGIAPIMVPPDGKEILVGAGTFVTSYDGQGLFQIDQFEVGPNNGSLFYRFALSSDGNTLFAISGEGNGGLAYNWRTHAQLGWVPTFTTGDLESWTTPEVADETGLIAGVIGNGVSFLDGGALLTNSPGTQVPNPSAQPTSGSPAGGTPTVLISDINASRLSQVFFGNGLASGGTVNYEGVNVNSPPGNPGPVDTAVTATDGAIELSPEWFTYGPWIIETTPNASTSEGGGTATIYGYGFGNFGQSQQAPGLQVSIGGKSAAIVQYLPTLATAQLDPYYPFPLEGIVVTVPAGTAGSAVDITVSNGEGSITAHGAFTYLPATQQFPLTGAALAQGIYDSHRDLYYFTDQTQVQVFSRTQGQWLAPIPLTNSSRLWGITLSPDGSQLAVADAGSANIYVVNPSSPPSVKTFVLPNYASQNEYPGSLVITNSGIIYFSSFYTDTTGGWAFHKLDSNTGIVTDYSWLQAGAYSDDAYARVLMADDNTRVYVNDGGGPIEMDTSTEDIYYNPIVGLEGDYEMTLSSNGTWMSASEFLTDTNIYPESYLTYAERETWNVLAVYGEKLSPDGNLMFLPLQNAIDVMDGRRGTLMTRISLPVALSANYDALVADGQDNMLIGITGATGTGIAVIDLTSVPEPPPLPYASAVKTSRMMRFPGQTIRAARNGAGRVANKNDSVGPVRKQLSLKHKTNAAVRGTRSPKAYERR